MGISHIPHAISHIPHAISQLYPNIATSFNITLYTLLRFLAARDLLLSKRGIAFIVVGFDVRRFCP